MPSSLPDPVLALSLANVQKLNNVDLDQLANLWNVFTKCKESLESGRRLENLSWRLWFREAHLLPADTSLSDITDYTPLDTPLMSRRGSVVSPPSRTMPPSFSPLGLSSHTILAATQLSANVDPPSDPEDGNWSDDEDDMDSMTESTGEKGRGRRRPLEVDAASSSSTSTAEKANGLQVSEETASKDSNYRTGSAATTEVHPHRADPTSQVNIVAVTDRKRAVSSSSAFGSRARVKQHNTSRRHGPLSFQQAIESLMLDRNRDFASRDRIANQAKPSSQKSPEADQETNVEGLDTNSSKWEGEMMKQAPDSLMQQNSAPAEFSQPSTPAVLSPAALQERALEADRKKMPPPTALPDRLMQEAKESLDREASAAAKKKSANFFVGGQSIDDANSSVSGSMAPSHSSSIHSTQQHHTRKAPSEAASDRSHRPSGNHRAHGHHGHAHNAKNHHGVTVGVGRNKSAVALNRALRGKGHDRVPSIGRGLHGLSGPGKTAQMDHSTGADGEGINTKKATHAEDQIGMTTAANATKASSEKGEKNEISTAKAKPPVKFIMGGDDEDDEFTDDDSEQEVHGKPDARIALTTSMKKKESSAPIATGEDNDEWSSASSTDSEEVRKRSVVQRKREEQERQQAMFQKVPVKSASTANVHNLQHRRSSEPKERTSPMESPTNQPARGLLSSLFHPDEQPHPPPGQLAGRPHASAADLRQRPKRVSGGRSWDRQGSGEQAAVVAPPPPRVPSSGQISALGSGGGLKLSKSAVALPVLSTMGSRTEAKPSSKDSVVFDDDESGASDENDPVRPSSEALARLNQLAQHKKKQKRGEEQPPTSRRKRSSGHSLNIEVAPEVNDEAMKLERREERKAPMATPSLSSHRSMTDLPETGQPQTPRTTRRNMLRDELSDSLRQNLLWERQSRNRNLGIGALPARDPAVVDSRSRSQMASSRGNQTVLGGGPLRPLTSSTSISGAGAAAGAGEDGRPPRRSSQASNSSHDIHRTYTGDFHHAGW